MRKPKIDEIGRFLTVTILNGPGNWESKGLSPHHKSSQKTNSRPISHHKPSVFGKILKDLCNQVFGWFKEAQVQKIDTHTW